MTLDGVEVVSLLPIQAVTCVREDVATSVAQAQNTQFALQIALVAYRADVDVRADVATSVAQAQDALPAFQMVLVSYRVGVDHLKDLLYLRGTHPISSFGHHVKDAAVRILRLLVSAHPPSSYHWTEASPSLTKRRGTSLFSRIEIWMTR